MAEKSLYKMTSEFQILTEMLEDETAPQDEIGKALIALQSDIVTKEILLIKINRVFINQFC